MSLELAAQHLASRGRKGDTMLVHMAPQEVSGLQALARAHGGTLTVNPDTGLPEANFLKRMLPMLIGAALTPLTGGLINPMTAGLLVGGLETARTGNLGKGLMAGLGAYGGAGLGAGLMGAGAGTAGATASALGVPGAATGAGSQAAMLAAQNQGFGQAGLEALGSSAGYASGAAPVVQSGMQSLGAGAQGLLSEQGRNAALSSMGGGMGAAKYGLAALSPMLMQGDSQAPFAGSGPNPYEYDYDPNTQRYTRVPPGSRQRDILAPITKMAAAGGPIEEMSERNQMETMMANGGQMFATGGQINLQGTFDVGGGGQSGQENTNGYRAAGSGGGGGGGGGMGANTGADVTTTGQFGQLGNALGLYSLGANVMGNFFGANKGATTNPSITVEDRSVYSPAVQAEMAAQAAALAAIQAARADDAAVEAAAAEAAASYGHGDWSGDVSGDVSGGGNVGGAGDTSGDGTGGEARGGLMPSRAYRMANGGMFPRYALGGLGSLGGYSDGGRLLKGPGDGVSDSIPATIGRKQQPARLADGEFVIPARIVSELGNGSTDAGARKLYAMMDRVQKARGKTTGRNRVAVNSRTEKLLPA